MVGPWLAHVSEKSILLGNVLSVLCTGRHPRAQSILVRQSLRPSAPPGRRAFPHEVRLCVRAGAPSLLNQQTWDRLLITPTSPRDQQLISWRSWCYQQAVRLPESCIPTPVRGILWKGGFKNLFQKWPTIFSTIVAIMLAPMSPTNAPDKCPRQFCLSLQNSPGPGGKV